MWINVKGLLLLDGSFLVRLGCCVGCPSGAVSVESADVICGAYDSASVCAEWA